MKKIVRKIPGYSFVQNVLSTSTFRQSSITFTGTILNGALGAIFYILVARYLGPSLFGLMSVAIAVLTLVADIGDFGTDTGLVNFVARNLKENKEKAHRFLKLGLKIKIIIGISIFFIGVFMAPAIARFLFAKPELANPLKISFMGVLAVLLFSFIIHSLQAFQKFWQWSGIQVGTNAIRVLLVFALLYYSLFNLESVLVIYIAIPFLGFFIGLWLIDRKFIGVKNETSVAKEFFKYNKWVAVFTVIAAFSSRLDTFISARLLAAEELGYYSAANQLVKIVPQIVTALGTVIAPKMAELGGIKEFIVYFKKTQLMVLALFALGILSIPVVTYLIPILYGGKYLASVPIFIILLLAMLVFLLATPVHMAVFYYFSYPKLFFYLSIIHLVIIAAMGWCLISFFGAIGAAISVLVGSVVNFVIPTVWIWRRTKLASH